jgi:hypothetical protein
MEELIKQAGEIPENTCPDIDNAKLAVKKCIGYVNDISRTVGRYPECETCKECKSISEDISWTISDIDLEKLRQQNERLRELGIFWYETCKELLTNQNK